MCINYQFINCGKPHSVEEQAAQLLISNLKEYFANSKVSGDIVVITNIMLYGGARNEIDIILMGKLDGFELQINSKYKTKNVAEPFDAKLVKTKVKDFCFILEHKRQTMDTYANGRQGVVFDPLKGVIVYYNSTKTTENASTQAKTQSDVLHSTIEKKLGVTPFVVPLIWLQNIPQKPSLQGNNIPPNVLYGNFTVPQLFEAACSYNSKYIPFCLGKEKYVLSCQKDMDVNPIGELIKTISQKPIVKGEMTRKRIEMITNDVLNVKLSDLHYEKGLLLFDGKAGTGNTSALLRIAHLLKEEYNARCMILTYNRALVGDMCRTFAFLGEEYTPDGEMVDVNTMQHFFITIMDACGIEKPKYGKNYLKEYSNGLKALNEFIDSEILDKTEIDKIKREKCNLSWDYVLVDEGQDWSDEEKSILLKFYADGHLIVADGKDQIVIPGGKKQNWTLGLSKDKYDKTSYKNGLRQLSVLNDFCNAFAEVRDYDWKVGKNPNKKALGGHVAIFSTKDFVDDFSRNILGYYNSLGKGNEAYDLMLLVPHQQTEKDGKGNVFLNTGLKKGIEDAGLKLFDGTNDRERSDYPIDQMRVFQYESCRGLEAWTTICLDFDVFLNNKESQYVDRPNPKVINTYEQRKRNFVNAWAMMPITRPVHTLVITVNDTNSQLARDLRNLANKFEDIECYI